jgi:hypothetical protein
VKELNSAWVDAAGEAVLAAPSESEVPDVIGPVPNSIDELCDIALRLQAELILDSNLATAKKRIDISDLADNEANYRDRKSIGYIALVFKRASMAEESVAVLRLINDLRNAKGHKLNAERALDKDGLGGLDPRRAYFATLNRLCDFLDAFKRASEIVLARPVFSLGQPEADDPWAQVGLARGYFQTLVPGGVAGPLQKHRQLGDLA